MAFANYDFTVNLYSFMGRLASRLTTDPDSVIAAFNVRDTADATAQLVEVINERQDWLLSEAPALIQVSTTSVTLTPGTLAYPIPDDLFRTDYQSIQFNNANDLSYRLEINFLNPADFRRLPATVQMQSGVSPYPAFFTFDLDVQNIVFTGFSTSFPLIITYRQAPDPILAADIDDPASTNYFAIPNKFIDVLVLAVAIEIGERIPVDVTKFHEVLYGRRNQDIPGKLRDFQEKFGTSGAGMLDQMATQGTPYSTLVPKRFGGVGSRRLGTLII